MRPTLLALLLLAGCGEGRPPAPTAEQNEQLNEVEAMLNETEPPATPEPAKDRP